MPKAILTTLIFFVLSILVYFSPDDNSDAASKLKQSEEAIKQGRLCALYLFSGSKRALRQISLDDETKSRINDLKFKETSWVEIRDHLDIKDIPFSIFYPDSSYMELIEFERIEGFAVMTFAYMDSLSSIVEIPAKGKLLYTVAVRFYNPIDDRFLPKIIRKTANLPLIRNIAGRLGTTAHWEMIDYNYNYNLPDYFKWALSEGAEYFKKKWAEYEKAPFNSKEFEKTEESWDETFSLRYEWASIATKRQAAHFEGMNKTLQDAKIKAEGK